MSKRRDDLGYLPHETPTFGRLIIFAIQQVLVMFPATVTVALLTGFHVSTTIFASGIATLGFLFITKGQIPLYYGSSFTYISAIVGVTGAEMVGGIAPDEFISKAQFGIIMSGFVSIIAGIIVNRFGVETINKVLPPTVTGSIAMIIGLSLVANAMSQAGYDALTDQITSKAWIVAIITLITTVVFSVYLKGLLGQIPILLGMVVGYIVAIPMGLVDFTLVTESSLIAIPHFTLPKPNLQTILAIMPIALATIPESAAHLFQLDVYVNDLARRKGADEVKIADKLGLNLIGDGSADIISALFGGPAGTNYGENVSAMAITRNFSTKMLGTAAIIAMIVSFFEPLTNLVRTIPSSVINGSCIFLFGVIAAQGIAIMIDENVDMFDPKNLAVIAIILTVGLGGHYGFDNGMIPMFGLELPAIATSAIVGIIVNLLLSIGKGRNGAMEKAKESK